MELNKIYNEDCIEGMKKLPDNSVDCIVTDPPYGLGFMNNKWDVFSAKEFQKFSEEWGKQALRVLKHGGYLLSFSGTRTYHRMVAGLEDAGFEIKDCLSYLYGSGFPKSFDLGKGVDEIKGNERKVLGKQNYSMPKADNSIQANSYGISGGSLKNGVKADRVFQDITKGNSEFEGWGTALKPAQELIVLAQKPRQGTYVDNVLKWGVGGLNIDESRIDFSLNEPDSKVGTDVLSKATQKSMFGDFSNVADKNIKHFKEGRFPSNVILECTCDKVIKGKAGEIVTTNRQKNQGHIWNDKNTGLRNNPSDFGGYKGEVGDIHTNPDCPCYILDQQSGILGSNSVAIRKTENSGGTGNVYTTTNDNVGNVVSKGDVGGASRFFKQIKQDYEKVENVRFLYTAKTSKEERNLGCEKLDDKLGGSLEGGNDKRNGKDRPQLQPTKNNHPTVKPIELMKYLVNLVSRKGQVVLEPFTGSGSTLIACVLLDRNYIGFEMDKEYIKISEARLNFWKKPENRRLVIQENQKIIRKVAEDIAQTNLEKWE